MKVIVKHQEGAGFLAETASGHPIQMDAAEAAGGRNLGARPMEVVLAGLGGCSTIDVMMILKKSRQVVHDCTLVITAKRADTLPPVFTEIHLSYQIRGRNLEDGKVQRAVSLSVEKYCSVTRMLEKTATISYEYKIGSEAN